MPTNLFDLFVWPAAVDVDTEHIDSYCWAYDETDLFSQRVKDFRSPLRKVEPRLGFS